MTVPDEVATNELRVAAAWLSARASIRDVRLVESSAKVRELPTIGSTLTYDLAVTPVASYEPGEPFFSVEVQYELRIESRQEDSEEKAPLAQVRFIYAALFDIDRREGERNPTEDELSAYASTTGHFALYPYVREYVQDLTGRLAFPPLTLRVLQISLPSPEKSVTD